MHHKITVVTVRVWCGCMLRAPCDRGNPIDVRTLCAVTTATIVSLRFSSRMAVAMAVVTGRLSIAEWCLQIDEPLLLYSAMKAKTAAHTRTSLEA